MKTQTSILKTVLVLALAGTTALLAEDRSTRTAPSETGPRRPGTTGADADNASSPSSARETRANNGTGSTVMGNVRESDRMFFEKAAKSGLKEVAVSQAVMSQLTNPQVREYAQMMVTDHGQANTQLMALASRRGVTLPTRDEKDMTKLTEKWSRKSGDEVDEDYLETMIDDHQDAIELYEKAASSQDADIAAFAQQKLPTLRTHLDKAKQLEKMVDN